MRTRKPRPEGNIDPFGMANRCRKPIVTAAQGIVFTVGIEMMLAGDIVVAADDCRFCQMEAKRGIAPLGGAQFRFIARAGWGDAIYHLLLCDEFSAREALRIGVVQEVVGAGAAGRARDGARAGDRPQRAVGDSGDERGRGKNSSKPAKRPPSRSFRKSATAS